MDCKNLEEDIKGIKEELKKLNNFLKYIGIPIAIMAIVDILDNLMHW